MPARTEMAIAMLPIAMTRNTKALMTDSSAERSCRREPGATNWLWPVCQPPRRLPVSPPRRALATSQLGLACHFCLHLTLCLTHFLGVSKGVPVGAFLASFLRIHCCIHGDPLGRHYECSLSLVHSELCGVFPLQVSGARRSRHLH